MARIWGGVFAVIRVAAIVSFCVSARRDGATGPLIILPVVLLIVWRNTSLGLRSDGDIPTVPGPSSTRRVRRDDIADVRRGEQTSPGRSPTVVVTTKDGAMPIGPPTTSLPFGRRSRDQIDDRVEQIRSWVERHWASRCHRTATRTPGPAAHPDPSSLPSIADCDVVLTATHRATFSP